MPTKMVLQQYGELVDGLEGRNRGHYRLGFAPELERVSGRFFDRTEGAVAEGKQMIPVASRGPSKLSAALTAEPIGEEVTQTTHPQQPRRRHFSLKPAHQREVVTLPS